MRDFRDDFLLKSRLEQRGRVRMISFKGAHFPQDIILMGVRWYVAYPLSTRHVEALMLERGVHVDHATINRWVIKYSPQLEDALHRRKRPIKKRQLVGGIGQGGLTATEQFYALAA
jgi:hypothetical protein